MVWSGLLAGCRVVPPTRLWKRRRLRGINPDFGVVVQVVFEAAADRSHAGGFKVDLTRPLIEEPGCGTAIAIA
jgi:hypothetical protein